MAATFDKIAASSIQEYVEKTWFDNFFQSRALFFKLKERSKSLTGGTEIRVPIMHGANTTAGSYASYDTLDVSPQQPFANAAFNWKQYSVSIPISGAEEAKNRGDAQILDLLSGLEMNARESLFNVLNTDAFGDGTSNGSKVLDGLAIQVDSTGTLGGINQTTQTWWASNEDAMGGALTIAQVRNTFNDCTHGTNDAPDLIVTTQAIHEAYEGLLQPDMRFEDKRMGEGGFKSIVFRGVPIVFDAACTAQAMYLLNTKYLGFRMMTGKDFKVGEWVKPANQDARVSQVFFMGNIVNTNRRKHGKITGITG